MLFAILFAFWRFAEIITLIPVMGMLAWFVNGYVEANLATPESILVLFIVSVLALAWAVFTLFSYHRSSGNARFVGLVDLALVGALIAGVYYLRGIARADCVSASAADSVGAGFSFWVLGSVQVNTLEVTWDKGCSMLKACFAMGIMNCVFFFITAVMAWVHGDHAAKSERKYVVERRRSSSRHGSRSRSAHRAGSRRSSHSHHRAYV
ncbi:hypothetical protein MFIFM68171_07850 [Madurella fahalii]|uniref:MARVEL domain-containing protein n=1 Tax=Madurella fahalii TaxID=1157608 RepID=A0ABQ0GJC2_9PEZI